MEGSSSKDYMLQEFDHELFLQLYCNPSKYPALYEELVQFPLGHAIQNIHLDIFILELNESCVKALEKWLKKEENALDCAGGVQFSPDFGTNRLNLSAKEEILRGKVKSIKKYDLRCAEASVPQKADCMLCAYVLEYVSEDEQCYLRNLKSIGSYMKIGGVLIASGLFNCQLFTVGEKKFNNFPYDEILLRRCMKNAGFAIKVLETRTSKRDSAVIQYDKVWFVVAVREREV